MICQGLVCTDIATVVFRNIRLPHKVYAYCKNCAPPNEYFGSTFEVISEEEFEAVKLLNE